MDSAPETPAGRKVPDAFYRLIQQQTSPRRSGHGGVLLACAAFVIICALLVLALELGADIEQILLGAFGAAVVNLIFAVGWIGVSRRP